MARVDSRCSLPARFVGATLFLVLLDCVVVGNAASIYVLEPGTSSRAEYSAPVINQLSTLGYSVDSGGVLADYGFYDQVWDLRFDTTLTEDDFTAYGNYLASGGRMYLSGENSRFFIFRNNSLHGFTQTIGAGNMEIPWDFDNNDFSPYHYQDITTAGQIVNAPNEFSSVRFSFSCLAPSPGNGFFVTEHASTGRSSLIGWDFGQIEGRESARMLISFDADIFDIENGIGWTENMATYLGGSPVSEPTSFVMFAGLGIMGLVAARRRRRAA